MLKYYKFASKMYIETQSIYITASLRNLSSLEIIMVSV